MSTEPLIRCENVSKRFCRDLKRSLWYGVADVAREFGQVLGKESRTSSEHIRLRNDEFWANQDISFEIHRGESFGLIGLNGAGKTTLLKLLSGLIKPDTGRIEIRGSIGALIALGAGFNPVLTGRENIYVNGAVLGMSVRELTSKLDEIIAFAELADFIDAPVRTYSSGMSVRLGFAIASIARPDILLIDEVLAVGDLDFRRKCYSRLSELKREGTCCIIVSHSLSAIGNFADQCLYLDKGRTKMLGSTMDVLSAYEQHNQNSRSQIEPRARVTQKQEPDATLQILEAEICDSTGQCTAELQSGGNYTLSVLCKSTRPSDDVYAIITAKDVSDRMILYLNTKHECGLQSIPKGVHKLKLEIISLGLLAGWYNMQVSLYEGVAPTIPIDSLRVRVTSPDGLAEKNQFWQSRSWDWSMATEH